MNIYDSSGNTIDVASEFACAPLDNYGDISTASGFVSAFDSAMADEKISGISIPFGAYNVNAPLNITRSCFVIDGNGCTLNMRTDAGVAVNTDCFKINGKTRIIIKNFLINMRQNANSSSGTAFYFLDAGQVTVENIDVFSIGCRGALIYNTDATSTTPGAKKIFFKNVKLRGIDAQNTTESQWPCGIIAVNLIDSGFEDCVVSGMCRFALEFKNYTKNCYMKNNVIYGGNLTSEHESGLALGGDRPDSENILGDGLVFVGNVVRNCKFPLYLGRVANSVFSDNVFEGQIFATGLNSCVVNGNVIKSTSKYSIPLIRIAGCEDLLMSENLYDPGQNDLFYVPEANTNVLVKGYMNGYEINVPNPTSGTPTLT